MAGKQATDFDVRMGERVRNARLAAGLTQRGLSEHLGVSYAQLQKYEHGTNCMSASTVHTIAKVLNLPIAELFDPDVAVLHTAADRALEAAEKLNEAVAQLLGAPRRSEGAPRPGVH